MLLEPSFHTIHATACMETEWMSYGMNIPESLKPTAREGRDFVTMLSHVMPFLETGRKFSALTTEKQSCSPIPGVSP